MTTIDLSKASLEELRATQELLQEAHDYTEAHGFDILQYNPRDGRETGPICYIGTVRRQVGLNGSPGAASAASGDGEELKLALAALDRIAIQRLSRGTIREVQVDHLNRDTGRYIEALGFDGADSKEEALKIYRQALTDVYDLIEAKL